MSSQPALTQPLGGGIVCPVRDDKLSTEYWTDSRGVNHLIWNDQEVRFILVRDRWSNVQPKDGAFDWTYYDEGIALAREHSKPIILSVDGSNWPQWLSDLGVPTWTSGGDSCPYPWDPTLQAKWKTLIKALGNRYDKEAEVIGITMWAGGTGIETFFSRSTADNVALDRIAGGGPGSGAAFFMSASKVLIKDFITAFPSTALYLATGQIYSGDKNNTMTDLLNWFLSSAGGSQPKGAQSNGLSASYPSYDSKLQFVPFPHTNLNSISLPVTMYQYVSPVKDVRMQGATNKQVLQNGYAHGGIAVQLYPKDCNADNAKGLIWYNNNFDQPVIV